MSFCKSRKFHNEIKQNCLAYFYLNRTLYAWICDILIDYHVSLFKGSVSVFLIFYVVFQPNTLGKHSNRELEKYLISVPKRKNRFIQLGVEGVSGTEETFSLEDLSVATSSKVRNGVIHHLLDERSCSCFNKMVVNEGRNDGKGNQSTRTFKNPSSGLVFQTNDVLSIYFQ